MLNTLADAGRVVFELGLRDGQKAKDICPLGGEVNLTLGNLAGLSHLYLLRLILPRLIQNVKPWLSRLLKPDCPTDRVASVEIRDFLTMPTPAQPFDVALGNPPFNLALEVIQHALTMSSVVCMLLRINFLASQKRAAWMREHTPSIYVLPKRPSFTGGKTDATEYAWFCWDGKPSRVVIL